VFKLFLTIIFSTTLGLGAIAQDINETLALANSLYGKGQYESAAKLYRRAVFFGNDSLRIKTYPRVASCYLSAGNYQESMFFYELASNTAKNDSLFNEYMLSKVLCHIMLNNLDYALQDLYSVNDGYSEYFGRKYHFYLGIIHLKKNEINESQFHFLCATQTTEHFNLVVDAYNIINPSRPNPSKAGIMSMFLPGLGQLYSGDKFSAANSFALNAGLIALMVYVAVQHTFIDGLLSVGPWFQRYYTGGFSKAERIAEVEQEKKREELLLIILNIFENQSLKSSQQK
jgi:tetratricopeptide (TPR) repeat protein